MPKFALRNPHFIVVVALITAILGVTAFVRMPVDVFPPLHIKAAVVGTYYPGFAPVDLESDVTSRYERYFTLGGGIEHVTSRSLYGVSLITLYFHPDVNLEAATSQFATLAMGALGIMPTGTLPPIVLAYDASSSTPVLLVTVSGPYDQTELQDQARYNIRNFLATVQGASVPFPFGGKIPQIMAYVKRQELQARGLTLMDVVGQLNTISQVLPSGDAKIGNLDYYVMTNAQIPQPHDLNPVPIRVGSNQSPVYFGDVGNGERDAQIQYNMVLVNGKPAVYVGVFKQPDANTISVVHGIEQTLPTVTGMPKAMKLTPIFSQVGYILDAVHSLEHEAASGALLASFMILIFLGSLRSTFAIFLSIPLSILAASFGLYMNGSTINIMTLGGFTLAIGRLVDDSIVVLENINRHLAGGKEPYQAAQDGAEEVALPVLASTITTIIVFFPVIFLFGVAKYLFSALAAAMMLAMGASYLMAMTVIPIYCGRFLSVERARHLEALQRGEHMEGGHGPFAGFFALFNRGYHKFTGAYEHGLNKTLDYKFVVIGAVAAIFVFTMFLAPRLGTQYFPTTDAGKFIINIRTPTGTRLELTTAAAQRIDKIIHRVIPPSDLEMDVANLGVAPNITAMFTPNSGEDTGQVMVELKHGHKRSSFYYMDKLKQVLNVELPEVKTFFSSGSIVDAVLNFGALAPIDVQVTGPVSESWANLFAIAYRVQRRLAPMREVKEAIIQQVGNYPTLKVDVDRVRAARLGVSEVDVVNNLITAINNNAMIAKNIWIDPAFGEDYYLSAQYYEHHINSLDSLRDIPVGTRTLDRSFGTGEGHEQSIPLRAVATISHVSYPSEADHYNVQRVVDVDVAPSTDDLGGTLTAVRKRLADFKLSHDVKIFYRGSVESMQKSFTSFAYGLLMSTVLLYLVMVAQFRSFLDPFIIMFAVPMGLIGVVWTLLITHTTLNIESFMGIIVMIGIVVSNSILLVDFANVRRRQGEPLRRAVVDAARTRMRPILMTAFATIVGLLPVGLALEEGSEASAPLARAAAGGLLVSTVFTLVLVPAVYELFHSRRREGK